MAAFCLPPQKSSSETPEMKYCIILSFKADYGDKTTLILIHYNRKAVKQDPATLDAP